MASRSTARSIGPPMPAGGQGGKKNRVRVPYMILRTSTPKPVCAGKQKGLLSIDNAAPIAKGRRRNHGDSMPNQPVQAMTSIRKLQCRPVVHCVTIDADFSGRRVRGGAATATACWRR